MNFTILAAAAPATGGMVDMVKETGETFGWNLGLFLSQVISFVVVALLLRQFAYTPILRVLNERRERIAQRKSAARKLIRSSLQRKSGARNLRRIDSKLFVAERKIMQFAYIPA